jgi:tagatose 1,6-diphosphate aldolase
LIRYHFWYIISIMDRLTIGKLRGLQQIAGPDGILTICAMDHRGSFRNMINPADPQSVAYGEMVKRKLELCSTFAPIATAVLIDPLFGAAQCISQGTLPGTTGLLVSIEATGYSGSKEHRVTELLEEWGVGKIKRMGASAVKMLVYYRPDLKELAVRQLDTVRAVAEECINYDIPFLVEPVSYPVGSEVDNPEEFARHKPEIVIETAREITALPIDVLKAEFPADLRFNKDRTELLELCRRLDNASRVPWVILSAGVDFDAFYQQVEIACQAGASGFLGGRALWQEAMDITDDVKRVEFLSTIGVDRMKRLSEVAKKYGTPWYQKYGASSAELTNISEGWFQRY